MKASATVVAFVVSAAAVAEAVPAFPECVPDSRPSAHVSDGVVVGCWGLSCTELETRKVVAPPATRLIPAVREAGKVSVCGGGTCRPVGPALSAVISSWMDAKAARNEDEGSWLGVGYRLSVTADRRFVVLNNPRAPEGTDTSALWSTERDVRIDVVRPAGTESQNTLIHVVGTHVYAMGTICANKTCRSSAWIVDSSGKPAGDFPYGELADTNAATLGPDRIAVSAQAERTFVIVDATRGTILASTRLPKALEKSVAITAIADDRIVVISEFTGGFRWGVVRVTGKKVAQVGRVQNIKTCPKAKLLRRDSSSSAPP